MTYTDTSIIISELNDHFRNRAGAGGLVVITPAVQALKHEQRSILHSRVICFNHFTEDNDPNGEHDFGCIRYLNTDWFWKIDYYADASCEWGSEDPSDPAKCYRVLTVMHASEY